MKYDDLSVEVKKSLEASEIVFKENIGFVTKLHKYLKLKISEATSEEIIKEFIELVKFLKEHSEYGVSTVWCHSSLNRYVYEKNKEIIKAKFENTFKTLARFYKDSDIINFYKKNGANNPVIIDLIGISGAGKTRFAQQFLDNESRHLLEKTITKVGNSTVIQTDVLINDIPERKLFLKVRNLDEILYDLIIAALKFDLNYKNYLTDISIAMKNFSDLNVEQQKIDIVCNLFSTEKLIIKFKEIAEKVQKEYSSQEKKISYYDWVLQYIGSDKTVILKEVNEILEEYLGIDEYDSFYGYRTDNIFENKYFNDNENAILRTLCNEEFKDSKMNGELRSDDISFLLFLEHAILVLPCSDEAKESLEFDIKNGLVLRDSQGHNEEEQKNIATDFEVKNKIYLIPMAKNGEIVSHDAIESFLNIRISEPEQTLLVFTRVDENDDYIEYRKAGYSENKEKSEKYYKFITKKMRNTHNNLINKYKKEFSNKIDTDGYALDQVHLFREFMRLIDNAFLSEIDDKDEALPSQAHKIVFKGDNLNNAHESEFEIQQLKGWFDIINSILKKHSIYTKNPIQIYEKRENIDLSSVVDDISQKLNYLKNKYLKRDDWQEILESQLSVFKSDFRSPYHKGAFWFSNAYINDKNGSTWQDYFMDYVAVGYNTIDSVYYISDNSNYINKEIVEPLYGCIDENYVIEDDIIFKGEINRVVKSSIEKALKISYKIFDRNTLGESEYNNLRPVFDKSNLNFISPSKTEEDLGIWDRNYSTDTARFMSVYANLLSKYNYNLDKYFIEYFKVILNNELSLLIAKK